MQLRSEEISIDISATGDLMVAGYGQYMAEPGQGAAACWDLRRGGRWQLPGHDGSSVVEVAIDPLGERVIAAGGPSSGPGFVKLWNTYSRSLARELPNEEKFVGGVAFSPGGDRLAVVSSGSVTLWDLSASEPIVEWRRMADRPMRVAFSPLGDVLAVGSFGGGPPTVTLFDAKTGEQLEHASFDRAIMDLAFSPDGRLLGSIDWGGKVEVYDRHQHRTVLSELAHEWIGMAVAFSPDGHTLATASSNPQIKLWHLPTMMHVTTVKARGRVGELAFFPDGKTLAVGYLDRTVELLHVNRDKDLFVIDESH